MQARTLFAVWCADLLRSLGSPSRIEILNALRDGPKSVGQLATGRPGGQPGVSKHLQILHSCGLVSREKRRQQVIYSISSTVERLCIELDAVAKCTLKKQTRP